MPVIIEAMPCPLNAPNHHETLIIRSPAPTRRSPRRIAKHWTRKAARGNSGALFAAIVPLTMSGIVESGGGAEA